MTLKRLVLFGALLSCLALASCQCADPPPIGPVEDEEEATSLVVQLPNWT
jgi:hypothetical protein